MARRRIVSTLGLTAGGLLGVAFLPSAVAAADESGPAQYSYDLDGQETITGIYNMTTAPPGVNESLQGYGEFDVVGSDGSSVGTFDAYSSTAPYLTPYIDVDDAIVSSQVLYVDSDGGYYPDGTIISVTHSGGGLFENVYSAIPGTDGSDTVSDTLITPFGNIDLTNLIDDLGFDAADVKAVLPDGITAVDDPTIVAVNGLPPLTIAEQGTQTLTADGGQFNVVETTTEDGLGFHTEAFLVTDSSNTSIPDGTVYNVIEYDGLENVYSSTPGADGDTVSDILYNSNGKEIADLSWLFADDDASVGLTDGGNLEEIAWDGNSVTADPDATETFTGINGLPPGNESVQGIDTFDYSNGTDTTTFTGDVTTIPDMAYSNYSEAILVTDSANTTLLPDGSVIDMTTYGNGWENIYTDMPGTGTSGDTITDYLVNTVTGNSINLSLFYQTIDASEGLTGTGAIANFLDDAWLDLFPTASTATTESAASVAPDLAGHVAEILTNLFSLF